VYSLKLFILSIFFNLVLLPRIKMYYPLGLSSKSSVTLLSDPYRIRIGGWKRRWDSPECNNISLRREYEELGLDKFISNLEQEFVGLKPVKQEIKEIIALLLINRLKCNLGIV
jgi:hypothetical protein